MPMRHPSLTQEEQDWFNYLAMKPQHTAEEDTSWQYLTVKMRKTPMAQPLAQKKKKKGITSNPRGVMDRTEILIAMMFVGIFSIFIIYAALFK